MERWWVFDHLYKQLEYVMATSCMGVQHLLCLDTPDPYIYVYIHKYILGRKMIEFIGRDQDQEQVGFNLPI